jgi:hypothetical protein
MQNEYPPQTHLKIVILPPSSIFPHLEIQMRKFTKRIPILTHLENSNALIKKRIVPVFRIKSTSWHRFTLELFRKKTPFLQNECLSPLPFQMPAILDTL